MNRAERRAHGVTDETPVLEITPEQLAEHMPHVKDGDVVKIFRNGKARVMRVQVITATATPEVARH